MTVLGIRRPLLVFFVWYTNIYFTTFYKMIDCSEKCIILSFWSSEDLLELFSSVVLRKHLNIFGFISGTIRVILTKLSRIYRGMKKQHLYKCMTPTLVWHLFLIKSVRIRANFNKLYSRSTTRYSAETLRKLLRWYRLSLPN